MSQKRPLLPPAPQSLLTSDDRTIGEWVSTLKRLYRQSLLGALTPFLDVSSSWRLQRLTIHDLVSSFEELSFANQRSVMHVVNEGLASGTMKTRSYVSQHCSLPSTAVAETPTHTSSEDFGDFMVPPTEEIVRSSIAAFRNSTGNDAVAQAACSCCAREVFQSLGRRLLLSEVPNLHQLRPRMPHTAQMLSHDGALLHPYQFGESDEVFMCRECLSRLACDQLPRYALANNLWIGDIPPELKYLSQPEKILISLYVPVAYIYKLYPKTEHGKRWASSKLHYGLRGNVSTYKLDQSKISQMISGTLPHSPSILSSTLAVSFVGPSNKVENWIQQGLPKNFYIRRGRVASALQWLKANNPLWASITISHDRLAQLPENGVPTEILATVRQSDDTAALTAEHASYIPADNDLEFAAQDDVESETDDFAPFDYDVDDDSLSTLSEDDHHLPNEDPDVIPIQSLGVVDVNGNSVTEHEILAHALRNTASIDHNGEHYGVKRGSDFINEYARVDPDTHLRNDGGLSNPNHLLGAFPCLFPYGMGGLEMHRDPSISYESHVRWALQYSDRRFRLDIHFVFQVFGVLQKRYVCQAAMVQMSTRSYHRHRHLLESLTTQDFVQASIEEMQKKPFSNPAVAALRTELKAIRGKVPTTDEARASVRSKIWGMILLYNPPNLWITINPADTHNPIAQVFAGQEIDLDDFCSTAGPDSDQRGTIVASDPYASAKFFHFIITAILEQLFGISKNPWGGLRRKNGILGMVRGYVGTVEAQGRGALHLHMLVWLKESPTPGQIKTALHTESFRQRITSYIDQVIHADLDNRNHDQILSITKETNLAYSRPLDPEGPSFNSDFQARNLKFARAVQLHQCRARACLIPRKGNSSKPRCKRRAPWELAQRSWIKPTGEWGPKRTCGYMNNWNPPLGHCLMSNHDIKLITSGSLTRKITWYITHYATKKQSVSSNTSALLARRLAFNDLSNRYNSPHLDANKRLLQACANTLSRDREISAPEVISSLMGWGDVYNSHHFVPIHWYAVQRELYAAFPDLSSSRSPGRSVESNSDTRTGIISEHGQIMKVDHLADYRYRGAALDSLSLWDFHVNTYDQVKSAVSSNPDPSEIPSSQRGRPLNQRVEYYPERKKDKVVRVVRCDGHETVPRFIGSWFPRSDRPNTREMYCASMLILLKPWRRVNDLLGSFSTFSDAFNAFMASLPATKSSQLQALMDNMQYFYDCADDADADTPDDDVEDGYTAEVESPIPTSDDLDMGPEPTDADIEYAQFQATSERTRTFVARALDIARLNSVFTDKAPLPLERLHGRGKMGTSDTVALTKSWKSILRNACKTAPHVEVDAHNLPSAPPELDNSFDPSICESPSHQEPDVHAMDPLPFPSTRPAIFDRLVDDQKRAYVVVEKHLIGVLKGVEQDQLLLQVQGRGGTGKSLLIQAITDMFQSFNASRLLIKTATSGIAASQIGGCTVHACAGIGVGKSGPTSEDVHDRRHRNLALKEYVIIDESSMMDKSLLCKFSDAACEARSRYGNSIIDLPFGGLNVLLFGDFHQFPPVANSTSALYEPSKSSDKPESVRGRHIYDQFDKVVLLNKQMRCQDTVWDGVLTRLREGVCTEDDIDTVKCLSLLDPRCEIPDFNAEPWANAILITSRHALRKAWNLAALDRHCARHNVVQFLLPSLDIDMTTKARPSNRTRLRMAQKTSADTNKKLDEQVRLAIGMQAMVLMNIATEADLANGTRGTIEEIIFDPREPPISVTDGVARLQYLPLCILLRPALPTSLAFPGIASGLLPITPSHTFLTLAPRKKGDKDVRIKRIQYAITAAYAFTDYKSQGQTIEYVIIDIAPPPNGSLSTFSIYVALSRSRGRQTIRILRGFDDDAFRHHPSESLRVEMDRLRRLNAVLKAEVKI